MAIRLQMFSHFKPSDLHPAGQVIRIDTTLSFAPRRVEQKATVNAALKAFSQPGIDVHQPKLRRFLASRSNFNKFEQEWSSHYAKKHIKKTLKLHRGDRLMRL
jgi:hypothetical protein